MEALTAGSAAIFTDPVTILMIFGGTFIGIIFGSIPGLTATLGVMLMIPFTFLLSPVQGVALLVSLYVGGISGGLITATLLNIPGTPSSLWTTLDGYPMTKAGKPKEALAIGVFASLIGGTVSGLALFFIAPQLAKVSLFFGSWEYFALALMGLCIVISMSSENIIKGLIAAVLGLLLGTIGIDKVSGVTRMTFGFWQLQGGLNLTAVMMGFFAIREILRQTNELKKEKLKIKIGRMSLKPPFKEMKGGGKAMAIGTLFGIGIGILPGIGQNAATVLAYNQAKAVSKNPEKFGNGSVEGIIAVESSNNAVNGAALIPLTTLGIPGDMVTAALIGGLMIHGLQPGPLLFRTNIDVVGGIMVAYFVANIVMYVMELGLMRVFIKLVNVKFSYLFPAIILTCILGVFALNNRIFDVWLLVISGIVGYIFDEFQINMVPMILGFILGPMIEQYYRTGMIAANGNFADILSRPAATVFFVVAILFLFVPFVLRKIQVKRKKRGE